MINSIEIPSKSRYDMDAHWIFSVLLHAYEATLEIEFGRQKRIHLLYQFSDLFYGLKGEVDIF